MSRSGGQVKAWRQRQQCQRNKQQKSRHQLQRHIQCRQLQRQQHIIDDNSSDTDCRVEYASQAQGTGEAGHMG